MMRSTHCSASEPHSKYEIETVSECLNQDRGNFRFPSRHSERLFRVFHRIVWSHVWISFISHKKRCVELFFDLSISLRLGGGGGCCCRPFFVSLEAGDCRLFIQR